MAQVLVAEVVEDPIPLYSAVGPIFPARRASMVVTT